MFRPGLGSFFKLMLTGKVWYCWLRCYFWLRISIMPVTIRTHIAKQIWKLALKEIFHLWGILVISLAIGLWKEERQRRQIEIIKLPNFSHLTSCKTFAMKILSVPNILIGLSESNSSRKAKKISKPWFLLKVISPVPLEKLEAEIRVDRLSQLYNICKKLTWRHRREPCSSMRS